MINYRTKVKKELDTLGLPVYAENFLHSGISLPCISYQEYNNVADKEGNTIGYSNLYYSIKIWGKDLQTLSKYSLKIDEVMRKLGFKRIASSELWDREIGQLQLRYNALALESFI